MVIELPKTYDPKAAQQRWLEFWEQRGYFHSDPDPQRRPFTIVIPPPNVTGALHMGHALNNTLQDVLIRWRRMQGYNALWIPGTDHAGIATQSVVERLIYQQEKKTRHELGREELVRRIWQWKDKYEARILLQLRQMGASCDFRRTRFTLDPVCARAVRETFFRMFRDGYIYRGKRLVNWDTQLQTSVADDETYTEETPGGFWTFKYPIEGLPDTFIRFSTTRPETMLGDTAVCVHPADTRYQHLIGRYAIIPLNGRRIPVIADALLADPTLGTGCVKVTPAHDPNDYACWQRHPHIGIINILNPDGTINENGGEFQGLDRYAAREAVIRKMQELGFYEGREDRMVPLKYSDRSKTPIEPYLSDQWFVRMGDREDGRPGLAQLAIDAVTSGRVRFFPDRYKEGYLAWLAEKRDWCISRQLWWGHRIPVWYVRGPEQAIRAAMGPDLVAQYDSERQEWLVCARYDLEAHSFGPDVTIRQEEDVLDTWFSSALWPHSTLGWPGPPLPEQQPDRIAPDWNQLRPYYYPTSVLVTSRDIITLWVARMVLASLYNVGEIPFLHVYVHPKVLDGFGETMSKTKGNGVDPLDVIDIYGVDALRYGMVHLATETQDSRMPVVNICPHCGAQVPVRPEHMYMRTRKVTCPECKKPFRPGGPWPADDPELPTARQGSERFEIGRNFANKLWNATRFLLLNLEGYTPAPLPPLTELPTEDRWILSRLATTARDVTAALELYRFSEVSRLLYDFIWSEFCDWYIELSKGRLKDEAGRPLVQRVLVGVLDGILRLVQPVMPFVAESLWQALGQVAPQRGLPLPVPAEESVVVAQWPQYPDSWIDPAIEQRFALLQELVRGVRELRSRYQLEERARLDVFVKCSEATAADVLALAAFLAPLAGINHLQAGPLVRRPPLAGTIVRPHFEAYVPLAGLIDLNVEIHRLEKQLTDKRKAQAAAQAKLANEKFVQNAPAEVVQQQRELLLDLEKQIAVLEDNLRELRAARE
ncbi:MAG: valine--tRNA ligase [Thermogemmata sp.]|nr:valine--tRNA ligase [Thermogemmata sp.]